MTDLGRHALRVLGTAWVLLAGCVGAGPGGADTLSARAIEANAREQATLPAATVSVDGPDTPAFGPGVGFRSRRLLVEHVEKHGPEFGTSDPARYLRLAQALRDTTAGGTILEQGRPDGVTTRFDRSTGSFIAFNTDRTIRTFFRPNDGEAYFRRQARRRSNR